jgi:nicotinamide-nucleotide amidase
MYAEILTIGDELCRGEVVDTNSSWIAARLWELGVTVTWMTSCRDERPDLLRALGDATARAELVVCSGGLGPTEDDLTVDVIAEAAGVAPVVDGPSLERMEARFARTGFALTPNNRRQVRVPAGADVLGNPVGLAPGFGIRLGAATVFAMPGVPREMHAIFEDALAPRIAALAAGAEKIAKRIYHVFGRGESQIDHALAGLVAGVAGATLHFQVQFPETLVKVVVRDADAAAARARLDALDRELRRRLGELVYGVGDETMAALLGNALRAAGATLAVAESCTGGMLGALVTDVPGSSDYFAGGWIVYANAAKERELGVAAATLARYGAVSRECVEELAQAARARAGATWAAAISGIAGPGGGSADKPVGTVHIAVLGPAGLRHRTFVYPGARDQVRRLACWWTMALIIQELRGSVQP